MKSAQCANDELSQPRGSTDEKLQVCQSGLSQRRGSPHGGVPLLCHVLHSNRCNLNKLQIVQTSVPYGLVTGKLLMLLANVIENAFTPSNGRLTGQCALILG